MLFGWPFLPRGESYLWEPKLIVFQVITNGIIALAFLYTAWRLTMLVRRAPDMTFSPALTLLFATLLSVSGVTHAFDIVTIWWAVYWTDGLVRAALAALAIAVVIRLRPFVPIGRATATDAPIATSTSQAVVPKEMVTLWKGLATNMAADLGKLKARRAADAELRRLREDAEEVRAAAQAVRWVAQEARNIAQEARNMAQETRAVIATTDSKEHRAVIGENLEVSQATLDVATETRDVATETRDAVKKNGGS